MTSPGLLPSQDSTPSSLLEQLRAKERGAWERFVHWVGPLVLYWCKRAGLPPEDRRDVFQEVFASTAKGIDRFQPRPDASFRGWLHRITRNQITDLVRKRLRQIEASAAGGSDAYARLLNLAEEESGDIPPPKEEQLILLRQTMELVRSEVEPQTWAAFSLTTVEGLSAPDAAAQLGMNSDAVRRAKARVLTRLRQHLDGLQC
jgi:RNA polymerase sigma-70 factor (ECF subfamily)